jgi:hypothetical protein
MAEFKLGQLLGGTKTQDELTAYSTARPITVVKAERSAAEKAARKAKWEAELLRRLPELVDWCRKDSDNCDFCKKTRSELAEVWGPDSPLEGPEGLVVFSHDLPLEYQRMGVPRHDRYHVEKALRALREAEYKAREARRLSAKELAATTRLAKGIAEEPSQGHNPRRKGGRFTKPAAKWNHGHRQNKG